LGSEAKVVPARVPPPEKVPAAVVPSVWSAMNVPPPSAELRVAVLRSASLPRRVRLKGCVTTANGLACTLAMASFAGRPVQVTWTTVPADNPVRRRGWVSLPTPD
jgi:hypothetical protein